MCVIVYCIGVMMSNHDTRRFCFINVLPEVCMGYGMKVTPKQLIFMFVSPCLPSQYDLVHNKVQL